MPSRFPRPSLLGSLLALVLLGRPAFPAEEPPKPLPESWEYDATMREVAARGQGRAGVILHIGDSMTYANPYGAWARSGAGRDADDRAILDWMHLGAENDTDGWWLARFDHPDGGRSHTAAGGLRADELLEGGKNGLPTLKTLLATYRPQVVILMIGTNDVSAGRATPDVRRDVETAIRAMLDAGVIPILSTIPPHPQRPERSGSLNEALRQLARTHAIPLIDLEREILTRRPTDWNGTLLIRDDVHLSADFDGATAASAPTPANLSRSGYLLRGWLSVRKIAEVKARVLDAFAPDPEAVRRGVVPRIPFPEGEAVRVPVTRDTWVCSVDSQAEANLGGSHRLKFKSYQEFPLIDLDVGGLKGRVIRGATLHLKLAGERPLSRVTVGTIAAEWTEGTRHEYEPEPGASSFRRRAHPDVPWTTPGSDLCHVILGQGGTLWRSADAHPPDADGWQRIAIEPAVVAARVAGLSSGFVLFDDTGAEWTRDGERFEIEGFPNRYVASRESGERSAPYTTVYLGPEDRQPPDAPSGLASDPADLSAGEVWLSWSTPRDHGPAGVLGFVVRVEGREVPRHRIPAAGSTGDTVRMRLSDLGLSADPPIRVEVAAVDAAGNLGPVARCIVRPSTRPPVRLPDPPVEPRRTIAPLPRLGSLDVAVLDELDKIHPATGALIPPQTSEYWHANHVWDASRRSIRLEVARNEFAAVQVVLRGRSNVPLSAALTFDDPRANRNLIRVAIGRYAVVPGEGGSWPDPIVPLRVDDATRIEDLASRSLHVEVYVSHDTPPGLYRGGLILRAGADELRLPVELNVHAFTLPDHLSFLPEMNAYDLPANERDYYRLAHAHRTVLNRVPYSQNGTVSEGCAPEWDGQRLDWAAWDQRFGPYFDGTAFADLPRSGVPIECFYLPLHENWPSPMEDHYNGSYWAERAFPESYREAFVEVSRQIAEHVHARGWRETRFQGFLNNKNNYKARGWSRGSSPWLLDEPAHFQDFWALRWFGEAFHEGVRQAGGDALMLYRCDISRPEWQRDVLDGVLDYLVVGGAFRRYRDFVLDQKRAHGVLAVEYGSANAIEESNAQAVAWCVDAWSLGADGVVPWQTIGQAESWRRADRLALLYPPRNEADAGPWPSIRLKAFRRGQQDAEYLTLYAETFNLPRSAVGEAVRRELALSVSRKGTEASGEDPGALDYGRLTPRDLGRLRSRIGAALAAARPPARARLTTLRTPPRDLTGLISAYVTVGDVPSSGDSPPQGTQAPGRSAIEDAP